MEIKYCPVTYADRIALLTNQNDTIAENNLNVHWGKILTISVIGIIAIIYFGKHLKKKSKELEVNKYI